MKLKEKMLKLNFKPCLKIFFGGNMKKIITILIFLLLFIPNIINASNVDYDIVRYYINADISTNGNLEVTELIVLNGTFNGYIRDIVYKNPNLGSNGYESNLIYNATNLKMLEISAKKVGKISFDTLNDPDFTNLTPNQGRNLGYTTQTLPNGTSYKMYFKSDNDTVAFKVKYQIIDAVVLHNDVAEMYWTFIGNDYADKIEDLQIKVNLPSKDNTDNFRVWAHGDMAGEINKYDNNYLLATLKRLPAYNSVDIRLTFDKNLINQYLVTKKTSDNALPEILKVEEERAAIQNKKRQRIKITYYTTLVLSCSYTIILILTWIYVYLKYDKEYKSTFHNEYNREFIDDYNVEVVDYLFNKSITPNAMSASITNLIYKKVITASEIPDTKKEKEYTFTLNENNTNYNETEKYLIDFLFQKVGENNTFTTIELKDYAKGTKTCEKFSNSYTTWKNKVVADAKNQNFFENKGKAIGLSFGFLIVAIVLLSMSFTILNILDDMLFLQFFNIFLSSNFLIYTFSFSKRTKKGNDDYAKWKAFKKFLNDFGTFNIKELPEIILWERYLVYATVFGIAKKVSESMNVRIKELETDGVYVDYYPTFTNYYFFHSIDDAITSSIRDNITAVTREYASSSYSSGGGHGGGFSSGGGHGGGGGGGRGF